MEKTILNVKTACKHIEDDDYGEGSQGMIKVNDNNDNEEHETDQDDDE